MPTADKRLYRVTFLNQGQVYEIYARRVNQGNLLGFVEIEGLVFGSRNQIVVDPAEERLQQEFAGVRRFFVPMHSVVRIDEVDKRGPSRISEVGKGTVTPFPASTMKPGRGSAES
jgi:hypothetical protein